MFEGVVSVIGGSLLSLLLAMMMLSLYMLRFVELMKMMNAVVVK